MPLLTLENNVGKLGYRRFTPINQKLEVWQLTDSDTLFRMKRKKWRGNPRPASGSHTFPTGCKWGVKKRGVFRDFGGTYGHPN